MPLCTECNNQVSRLVQPDTLIAERCTNCGQTADRYVEFTHVQNWIDLSLLDRHAWCHSVFNIPQRAASLALVSIVICLFEAYVVHTLHTFRTTTTTATLSSPGTAWDFSSSSLLVSPFNLSDTPPFYGPFSDNISSSATLQIAHRFRMDPGAFVQYVSALPRLYVYALVEYLMLVVVVICCATRFDDGVGKMVNTPLLAWISAASLVQCSKCPLFIFLVWRLPISLLVIVDAMYVLCLIRCFRSIFPFKSWTACCALALVAFCSRVLYRHATSWCTQLYTTE